MTKSEWIVPGVLKSRTDDTDLRSQATQWEFNQADVERALELVGTTETDKEGNEWTHPIVWSYGGGKDSTAGILRMYDLGIRPDLIIISDVGGEHPHTWQVVAAMNEWCQSHDFPEVMITRYYSPTTRYQTLEGNCLANMTLPSLAFNQHSCSLKWKIEAIEDEVWGIVGWTPAKEALSRGIRVTRCIGYDYGCADSKRFAKVDKLEKNEQAKGKFLPWVNRYPLREWKLARVDLDAVIAEHAEFGDLMEKHAGTRIVRKSSCFFCPAAQVEEVEEMARDYPDLALRMAVMEYRAETGKHGFDKVNGLGLGAGPKHAWDRVKGRRNWNWTKHLVAVGLLPENWLELAKDRGLIPSDWDEFSASCATYREQVNAARQYEFEAASKLPKRLFDKAYPPKPKQSKRKSERENRKDASEAVKKAVENEAAGTEAGAMYIYARARTKVAEKAKKDLIAIDWKRMPKPKPSKEVRSARRKAKKLFKAAVQKAQRLCAVKVEEE